MAFFGGFCGPDHHHRETGHQAKLVSEDPKQCHCPQGAVTVEELGLWLPPTLPTPCPQGWAPPYLGGPVAMDDHWEGVVGQIPCSHVTHFKLEYDFIWGGQTAQWQRDQDQELIGLSALPKSLTL